MIAGADASTVTTCRVHILASALDIWRRPRKRRLGDDDDAAQRLGTCRRLRHSADPTVNPPFSAIPAPAVQDVPWEKVPKWAYSELS